MPTTPATAPRSTPCAMKRSAEGIGKDKVFISKEFLCIY
jgi:hypothetical protein